MSITNKILPTGDAREVKALRQLYNQALGEKWEIVRQLSTMLLGTAGRAKLQVEIAKLHDIMIPADERIYLIMFYEHEQRKQRERELRKIQDICADATDSAMANALRNPVRFAIDFGKERNTMDADLGRH